MKVLVIGEQKKGKLKKASLELLSACQGHEVAALLFGSDASAAAEELATAGVSTVHWVKEGKFDAYHPDAYAAALEAAVNAEKPACILGSASSLGKDLVPKIAARLDCPIVTDCTELTLGSPLKAKRPFFSGKALAAVELAAAPVVAATVRPNALAAGKVSGNKGSVKELAVNFDFGASALQFVKRTEAASDRPDLTEANIIISGGRSMKTKENFKILLDAADVIGAAVGASRAAVDESLATHDMQVGQTGKTVNPSLYIACGISGAIQHLAGMRTSKVIVAINKDPQAPIFQKADYGVVGDLFAVVPAMTAELKKLKASS